MKRYKSKENEDASPGRAVSEDQIKMSWKTIQEAILSIELEAKKKRRRKT